jgi:hypothetical protein
MSHEHKHDDHGYNSHHEHHQEHSRYEHQNEPLSVELEMSDEAKLAILLPHLLKHNDEHGREMATWADTAGRAGSTEVAQELSAVVKLSGQISEHLRVAIEKLKAS